jgi:type IV pilus assembly protein PilQ
MFKLLTGIVMAMLMCTNALAIEKDDPTDTNNSNPQSSSGGGQDTAVATQSITDIAIDEILGTQGGTLRNPFSQGDIDEQFDPQSLDIQAIVIGPGVKMAIASGQIVTIDSRIGNFSVKDIKPGKIILSQLGDEYDVRMANYSPHLFPRGENKFFVEFHNANLKLALAVLGKSAGKNIILPEETDGKITVAFNNTTIEAAVQSILHVNKLEFAIENDIMRVGPSDTFKDGSDLKAISIPLNYATADELESKIKTFLSDRGKVVADKRTNTIIVKDQSAVIDSIRKYLASIDQRDPQVSIEAKIVDATTSFAQSLGIQWGFASGPNNFALQGNQNSGSISNSPMTGSLANFGATNPTSGLDVLVGRLPGNSVLQMQLSAAEQEGVIRIISKPSVTTLNNKEANMRSGDTIYVKVNSGAKGSTGEAELKEIRTGIELIVTPQITLNRMVKMNIKANESTPDFSRQTDGIPAVLENTASTTVLIPDGETAVIGGLLRSNVSKGKRGVPALSHIPVLGWLFKGTSKNKDNKELMIFITPKILDSTYYKNSAPDETAVTKLNE